MLYSRFVLPLGFVLRCQTAAAVASHEALAPRVEVPAPIVVAASQDWDGNDGPWSSFAIQVGTPSQNVKVFAATSGWETMAVMPGGCIASDPSTCAQDRGGFYQPNTSSTWVKNTETLETNIYPIAIDERLGYKGKASLGFDDITLGWPGSGGPKLKNQTVGGFITKEHYVGFFGLTPRAANFTSFDHPIPSFVQNLVNQSIIPSTSWSYTAGNQYRLNKVLGSLILGGYDSSRFVHNDVIFHFNEEDIRDLTVQIESITTNDGKTSLLPTSIPAMVDSGDSCIWLPLEACTLFEKAFGLIWDDKTQRYLLNATQHTALKALKPSVTFKLGNLTAGANVEITLPYAAFDLNVSWPIVAEPTAYFPLKRAANDTQYTLGRTFFQEAYVTADYDRRTFTVSQAAWVAGAQSKMVSILPPSQKTTSSGTLNGNGTSSTNKVKSSSSVPVAAIAGGVGGGIILLIVAAVLVFFYCIKPRRRKAEVEKAAAETAAAETAAAEAAAADYSAIDPATGDRIFTGFKAELDNSEPNPKHEMDGGLGNWVVEADGCERMRYEMNGTTYIYEKDEGGRTIVYEMDAKERGVWLVEADGKPVQVYEMPALEEVAHEMHEQHDSFNEVSHSASRRSRRNSWGTGDESGTLVGSSATTSTQASPDRGGTRSFQTSVAASPRTGQARLQRLPE